MPGSVYEKFGYNLPEKFGEIAEMCSTKFVCGKDKKWHIESSYKGESGNECSNQNTLKQICETHKSGKSSCVKDGELTYCYETVKGIPQSINSTGSITNIPEPGIGSFVCGFDNTKDTHITVLASSCGECPHNLTAYEGQKCETRTKESTKTNINAETPVKITKSPEEVNPEIKTVTQTKNSGEKETSEKIFSCRFSKDSYKKLQEVKSSCNEDNDCEVDDSFIVNKWVDSINVEMDTENFTINEVLGKHFAEGSELKNTCILGDEKKCNESFVSMEDLKKYLKDKLVAKQFLKMMKKDFKFGAHVINKLSAENNKCDSDGKCINGKISLNDYVHINPHEKNKIEIKKLNGENISSLFVNGKKVGGGVKNIGRKKLDSSIVHCSEEGSCKNYTENIDTVIDLNNSDELFMPKGTETVYKIIKEDDVFILDNEYTVKTKKEDSQSECSKLLCSANYVGCPTGYCKRDDFKNCVPSDIPVEVKEVE